MMAKISESFLGKGLLVEHLATCLSSKVHPLPLTIQNSKGSPERHSKTDPTQVDS